MTSLMQFHQGGASDLSFLMDGSIHSILTSPPYFGLRAYAGDQAIDWPAIDYAPMPGLPALTIPAQRCALGGESDPFAYIGHLLHCLREWRRVLRDDGVCMVNLGDSYNSAASNMQNGAVQRAGYKQAFDTIGRQKSRGGAGLKPKDLMLVPPRFALAAQADGWYVRAAIVWAKGVSFLPDYAGSIMPESVQDRPTRSHEEIYLLAKRERYFGDWVAVAENSFNGGKKVALGAKSFSKGQAAGAGISAGGNGTADNYTVPATRNLRSVWVINPRPFGAAHFACWPETLVDPMIRATTSERGCCPACGAPWVRVVEKTPNPSKELNIGDDMTGGAAITSNPQTSKGLHRNNGNAQGSPAITIGFTPSCTCAAGDPVPCTVLDPFSGSGTTGKVAVRLGRRYVGVDLASEYLGEVTDARMGAGVQMELV